MHQVRDILERLDRAGDLPVLVAQDREYREPLNGVLEQARVALLRDLEAPEVPQPQEKQIVFHGDPQSVAFLEGLGLQLERNAGDKLPALSASSQILVLGQGTSTVLGRFQKELRAFVNRKKDFRAIRLVFRVQRRRQDDRIFDIFPAVNFYRGRGSERQRDKAEERRTVDYPQANI